MLYIIMKLFCIIVYCLSFLNLSNGDRTSLKIYEDIQSDIFCFRRLNATHQIGCASGRNGNVGVLYLINNGSDLENIMSNSPPMPFVAALQISLFNMKNMKALKQLENIQGVLVLKPPTEKSTQPFSPDQSCPNKNFGFYTKDLNKEYAACDKIEWNELQRNDALGMMFEDWGMPIFIITNKTQVENITKCYERFNDKTADNSSTIQWPLCSVQMTSVMLAAKDSDTCMRRNKLVTNLNEVKTCDPLSDKNIVTTLFPTNKSVDIQNDSVIVVGARMDTFSMFDKLAPGAHSTVTGLVTLLAVAKSMAFVRDNIIKDLNPQKNVLFILFNGEAFDYIGSSRVVFDMRKGVFPSQLLNGIKEQPALMNLDHISNFIELSQLSPKKVSDSLWIHTDPVSIKNKEVGDKVRKLVNLFQSEATRLAQLKVTETNTSQPLPPASFQSFLRHDNTIPGIVVADHNTQFINEYYNSIFDTDENVNLEILPKILADVAITVTGILYNLLTDKELETSAVQPQTELISGLLDCYLKNASCQYFQEIADPAMTERLRVEPYPLYVSVDTGGHTKANAITLYTRYLLAYLTGDKVADRDRKNCTADAQNQIYQYDWMTGAEINASGICVRSTVMYTIAQSPAYVLNDWKSEEYSTWTESVWLETSARIFVQPGKFQEAITLVLGIIIFILSISSVYFVNERSSIIFNTKPLVGC